MAQGETITRKVPTVPSIFISKTDVNSRIKNFQDHKLPLLSNAIGKSDSTSAWYSMEQFDEIVREMHLQDASGLRVYFGAYDSTDELHNLISNHMPPTSTPNLFLFGPGANQFVKMRPFKI